MKRPANLEETPAYIAALQSFLVECGVATKTTSYPELEDLASIGARCIEEAPNQVVVAAQKELRRRSQENATHGASYQSVDSDTKK